MSGVKDKKQWATGYDPVQDENDAYGANGGVANISNDDDPEYKKAVENTPKWDAQSGGTLSDESGKTDDFVAPQDQVSAQDWDVVSYAGDDDNNAGDDGEPMSRAEAKRKGILDAGATGEAGETGGTGNNGNTGGMGQMMSKAKGYPGTGNNGNTGGVKSGIEDLPKVDYAKILEIMNRDRPLTPEEEEKLQKRIERNNRLAKIGNGLAAFHSAYSHARDVKPLVKPLELTDKYLERYDKMKADRDRHNQNWVNNQLKLENIRNAEDLRRQNEEYRQQSLELRRQQQLRLQQHEENQKLVNDAKIEYMKSQQENNYARAEYWRTKAELLEQGWPLEQAEKAAKIAETQANTVLKQEQAKTEGTKQAKNTRDANAPYRSSGGSSGGSKGSSSGDDGTQNVVETTDQYGHTTRKVTYKEPKGAQAPAQPAAKPKATTTKPKAAAKPKAKPKATPKNPGKKISTGVKWK